MYKEQHIHFVGIGGIGMSGIAEVLLNLKYPVSGSDLKRSSTVTRLRRLGAKVYIGHKEKNVADVDVMVVSSAVNKSNPEVMRAHKLGIPVIQRAEMLAELIRLVKYGIAVAGTHGKTTTTSLMASVLQTAKIDPTVIIGGKVKSLRSNARLGKGDFIITEADESDGSFLKLLPTIAVVTNIDHEHLDHYGSFKNCVNAFQTFCSRIPFYGVSILCGEDKETAALSERLKKRHQLYGLSKKHDWNAQDIDYQGAQSSFDVYKKEEFQARVIVNLPGKHNVLNALAVVAVADEIGISMKHIQRGLEKFKGVGRRMEILHRGKDVIAIDDYGHHPTEIKATLDAIRRAYAGRLVVLFQPHRYSRTRDLFKDFVSSFDLADHLFVTGVYSAGESSITGVSGRKLAEAIKARKKDKVAYLPSSKKMLDQVIDELKPGDVFLSLGAGDVTQMGRKVAKAIKAW
jgi:UDP-N-acetylmuramate--alanine ligase